MCRARRRWSFAPETTRVGSATPSAVVVVRTLPVLFPARIFCQWSPFNRTGLCTVQALSATSAVATSAGSRRPQWQAHGRRSMRPLCRPSAWSPCASCSTAPAPLSSAISSSGSLSARPQPPSTPSRLRAFACRRCSCAAAHVPSDPPHATNATHICHVTKDVLGRRRVRTGECGRASAPRRRAGLCVPRDAPR